MIKSIWQYTDRTPQRLKYRPYTDIQPISWDRRYYADTTLSNTIVRASDGQYKIVKE